MLGPSRVLPPPATLLFSRPGPAAAPHRASGCSCGKRPRCPVPGEHRSRLEEQLAVTCFVLSLPCQHFYATRISFSTFLSLTCLYFLCFLFCAGGRRTRFLCETAAVVNDGDKPAKTEGSVYSKGTPGHVEISSPTHYQQRALQSSVFLSLALCSPQSLPSAFSHDVLLLTPHLPLLPFPRCQPLAGRQTSWEMSSGWYEPAEAHGIPRSSADLSRRRARSPLPSLSSHACLHATNAQILTFLLTWRWPAAPGGWAGHRFTPALHVILQRHDDFFEFWLLLDKFDLVHLFGREVQPRDEHSCSSDSVKIISVRALRCWLSS